MSSSRAVIALHSRPLLHHQLNEAGSPIGVRHLSELEDGVKKISIASQLSFTLEGTRFINPEELWLGIVDVLA